MFTCRPVLTVVPAVSACLEAQKLVSTRRLKQHLEIGSADTAVPPACFCEALTKLAQRLSVQVSLGLTGLAARQCITLSGALLDNCRLQAAERAIWTKACRVLKKKMDTESMKNFERAELWSPSTMMKF